jgi:cytochrome bd-type quinol oxidase subunit 2
VLPTSLTVEDAAGVDATLTAVIVVFCVALVTVVPALVLLYRLAQKQALE